LEALSGSRGAIATLSQLGLAYYWERPSALVRLPVDDLICKTAILYNVVICDDHPAFSSALYTTSTSKADSAAKKGHVIRVATDQSEFALIWVIISERRQHRERLRRERVLGVSRRGERH
jgi:hypothetical protein